MNSSADINLRLERAVHWTLLRDLEQPRAGVLVERTFDRDVLVDAVEHALFGLAGFGRGCHGGEDLAYGDVWTWTGLDADSKLIISWMVGGRDSDFAMGLMDDLRSRLANRIQLTTDGHRAYLEAVAHGRDDKNGHWRVGRKR
jgi:hypothetical protein